MSPEIIPEKINSEKFLKKGGNQNMITRKIEFI